MLVRENICRASETATSSWPQLKLIKLWKGARIQIMVEIIRLTQSKKKSPYQSEPHHLLVLITPKVLHLTPEKTSGQQRVKELSRLCVMVFIRSTTITILVFRQKESVTPTTIRKMKHLVQIWTWQQLSLVHRRSQQANVTITHFSQVTMLSLRSS